MSSDQRYNFSYDGTIEGFLCIFDFCVNQRIIPLHIKAEYLIISECEKEQYMYVVSDFDKAEKVYRSIGRHAGVQVQQMVTDAFLTCIDDREMCLFAFICKSIKHGAIMAEDYKDKVAARIQFAIRDLYREAQSSLSNINIVPKNSTGLCVINPRNNILPLIKKACFREVEYDDIIIYDKRHRIVAARFDDRESVLDLTGVISEEITCSKDLYEKLMPYLKSSGWFSYQRKVRGSNELTPFWYKAG